MEEKVISSKARKRMPNEELARAAECLKLMAHPARLRIAELLTVQEHPVHAIADYCGLPPNQTCEHLRHMQRHGLLTRERRGREVFYRAASHRLHNLTQCLYKTCIQNQAGGIQE
jgi:DNA-binding transcriptional ArsR family regulator